MADVVALQTRRTDAPAVDRDTARGALAEIDFSSGFGLNLDQRQAVLGFTTSGRGVELVVGVAGAGKTTAVSAVRKAFEAEGYEVVGTSTSGQAARTLRRQAGIEVSRTLASVRWRLDHGSERRQARGGRAAVSVLRSDELVVGAHLHIPTRTQPARGGCCNRGRR